MIADADQGPALPRQELQNTATAHGGILPSEASAVVVAQINCQRSLILSEQFREAMHLPALRALNQSDAAEKRRIPPRCPTVMQFYGS